MVGVFALRLVLTLADPDLVHPIDPAELGHLRVWPALLEGRLLWLLGADANVHHGAFFWLGLVVGWVKAVTGSDLLAVRGTAAGLAALAWGGWVAVAHRAGGRMAAIGLGVCLALPSPWLAQWTATLWGSHSEAGVWTALWVWTLLRGGSPVTLGALLGVGVGWDPLLWPTALLTWALSPHRWGVLKGWVPALLLFRLPTLAADPAGVLTTSFSEHPHHTPFGLLMAAADPETLGAAFSAHLPLPFTATDGRWGWGRTIDWAPTLVVAAAGPVLWWQRRGCRAVRLLVLAPWLQLAVMVLLSPTRPQLAHRYWVAWWPALLTVPWLLSGGYRGAALAPVMASVLALPLWLATAGRLQPGIVWRYPSGAFQEVGLDRVPIQRAPAVVAWLESRGEAPTPGFAAAFSPRWGYPVWGEPFPGQVRAANLAQRLRAVRSSGDTEAVDRDFGTGLVVVCDRDAGCVQGALDALLLAELDTTQVETGIARAQEERP